MQMIRAIVVGESDNVATLIDNGKAGDTCVIKGSARDPVVISADIPFGHKVAIAPIAKGDPVIKHGENIGLATTSITVGTHVHIENVESRRGRGDLQGKQD